MSMQRTLSTFRDDSGAQHLRKFGNLSIRRNFNNYVTVRTSARPFTPQGNQCEMSNFLACVGACYLCLT